MADILYIATDADSMGDIANLWEHQKKHHVERATNFKKEMASKTWEQRRDEMLAKAIGGRLRLDLAYDEDIIVGYCIATVNKEQRGEIDSIYVEKKYRGQGIGKEFIGRSETWFMMMGAKDRIIAIAEGNEDVIPFYNKLGYFTSVTIMQHVDEE
jgi:diamine N-acetyltransferase